MKFFGRHLHDHHPSALNEFFFPSYEQVYLSSAKNANFLPHLLEHLPNILAKEKECWRKRVEMNGRKSNSLYMPVYVAEAIC